VLKNRLRNIIIIVSLSLGSTAYGAAYSITTTNDFGAGSLRQAIIDASIDSTVNSNTTASITFNIVSASPTITLTSPLLPLVVGLTLSIDGTNLGAGGGIVTIDGGSNYSAFFVYDGTLTASNLNIQNCHAKGGDGGGGNGGGGGGMGAGAAFFVNNSATVNLSNIAISNSQATAGSGGAHSSAGGGGGIAGAGGSSTGNGSGSGGGIGGNGGSTNNNGSGGGGGLGGNGGAVTGLNGSGGGGLSGNGGTASVAAGSGGGSGGGGIYANGGTSSTAFGGGGGGNGVGNNGANSTGASGGNGGGPTGGTGTTGSTAGGAGGASGGGGGGGSGNTSANGGSATKGGGGGGNKNGGGATKGGGGGGGTNSTIGAGSGIIGGAGGAGSNSSTGGNAITGGGGGGGLSGNGGATHVGGGGGSGKTGGASTTMGGGGGGGSLGSGGNGGFGGGSGGGSGGAGVGGFGGGSGSLGAIGQKGRALGGAIFVRDGGTLTATNVTISSSSLNDASTGTVNSLGNTGEAMYLHGSSVTTTFSTTTNQSIANNISGPGSLTKTGSAILALSGASDYSGGTIVSAGTLQLSGGNDRLLTTGNISIAASGTFDLNDNNQQVAALSGAGKVTLGSGVLTAASGTLSGVISGTGSLTKNTTGTLTLSGTNTYSGGTTVSAGTLTGTTTSLQGSITNNAAVSFDQATNGTYSGVVSGTGSLTKAGTGNATLSGANTYSGGTTVSAGTLTGTTTSLQGDITNNAAVNFTQAANGTYAGVVSGTGSLTKAGTGNATLSGANTYSGGTTVSAGTLTGTTTSLQGDITNNAALSFDQTTNGTYAGVVSGTGSLTKAGTDIVTLSGANTYSGGTTVSAGTLTGTTTSLQGDITNNAAVSFDQATNGTYAGVVSGTGGLTKAGTGIVTLSGSNTYSGGTTVSAGTSTGTTTSLQGDITNNAAVNFTQAANGTYAGVVSGTGSLTKAGTGNATLSGANTYSGGTTVSAGTLTGTTTSLQGDITNNAALSFDQTTNGTYAGVVSGTGSLTKAGTGNATLSGANTYSGGTTVSAGTLTGTTTSLQGDITNNAALSFDQTTNGTYAGVVSGTGSLTKAGTGIVTLSGANTYSGGTTVSAGTLTGTTTSLQGDITNNAAVNFTQAANGTYAGVVSGTGSLTKAGTGNATLSGANTYSGGTTVSAGTLTGTTTSLQGDITNNAALSFDQTTNGTYAGVVSGTGSLTKAGTGIVTLSGANTYSGGTTVSAGTLTGTTTSLQGDITNNAAVNFTQAANGTYAGVVSGTGSLTKAGTGIVTLSGANTYSGSTIVSAGTLQVNGGNNRLATTGDVSVASGATFDLNNNNQQIDALSGLGNVTLGSGDLTIGSGSFSGIISGTGNVIKSGTSTATFTGAHTYSGNTTISDGKLVINGSLVSPTLTINSGAILGGVGIVNDVINNGILAPGNSIGTINIAGNYTSNNGSILEIELDDTGSSDKLEVTGDANINGGDIKILPDAGSYTAGSRYTIIETIGQVNQTPGFNSIIQGNGVNLTMNIIYSANKIELEVAATTIVSYIPLNVTCTSKACQVTKNYIDSLPIDTNGDFNNVILKEISSMTSNDQKVAAVENMGGGKRLGLVQGAYQFHNMIMSNAIRQRSMYLSPFKSQFYIGQSSDIKMREVENLKSLLSGNIREEVENTSKAIKANFNENYATKIYRRNGGPKRIVDHEEIDNGWFKSFYSQHFDKGSQERTGYHLTNGILMAGTEVSLNDWQRVSVFTGLGNGKVKYKADRGSARMKHLVVGANISHESLQDEINYGISIGASRYKDNRKIVIGTITEIAKSHHTSGDINLYTDYGKKFEYNGLLINPKVSLELYSQYHQGYKEKGAYLLNLSYNRKLYSAVKVTPAIEISKIIKSDEVIAIPTIGLSYSYGQDLSNNKQASLADQTSSFNLSNNYGKGPIYEINIGLALKNKQNTTLSLQYNGQIQKKAQDHQASIGFEWNLN
jgi:fibronectin-binding autotransporter adhesin